MIKFLLQLGRTPTSGNEVKDDKTRFEFSPPVIQEVEEPGI